MSEIAAILCAFAIYPLAVLCVALTGPHNEAERRSNGGEA